MVQAKAQKLGVIKRQRKQVTEELAAFLAALGQATAEEARSYLLGLKQKQEAQIAAEQNRVDLDDDELAALFGLYCDAGRFPFHLDGRKGARTDAPVGRKPFTVLCPDGRRGLAGGGGASLRATGSAGSGFPVSPSESGLGRKPAFIVI